ncbi:unnamed protein product [Auanema sp. JU1783]|nr:unnamed protein product [Auanema sp. JU1783]
MDRSRLKLKIETPKERKDSKRSSDKPVSSISTEDKEQKKPEGLEQFQWTKDDTETEQPGQSRHRIVFPKPKYDYTNPPEDPAKTAALFAIVQAQRPDFMKESYTDELKMFLPLDGDMSHGPDCDNFISLHDQKVNIMFQRSIKDYERKERIRQIELEKKRPPARVEPILQDYERLRPRLEKYMAERRRLGLSDKIFEELPSIVPMTKSVGLLEPSPALIRARQLLRENNEECERRRKIKEERRRQLAARNALLNNEKKSATDVLSENLKKPPDIDAVTKNGTDQPDEEHRKILSNGSTTSGSHINRISDRLRNPESADDSLNNNSNSSKSNSLTSPIPAHMEYQPISIVVPSSENDVTMNEFTSRKKETVCQLVPSEESDSYTVPDSDFVVNCAGPSRSRSRSSGTVPDSDESPRRAIAPDRNSFKAPDMNRSRRRNAVVDMPLTSPLLPLDHLTRSRSSANVERQDYQAMRDRKRRNALLDFPKEIPLHPIDQDSDRDSYRNSLMDIYSHKEIPLSVIDPYNKAYQKRPTAERHQQQHDDYTDFDLLKSDPVLYREQLKELEYYQNLKKTTNMQTSRSQTSIDMEIDVVGTNSSTITDFTFNNPSTSSAYSPFGQFKKEPFAELPVVIPLELVGEKMNPTSLKSELMGLVDDSKSRDSTSTDCSSDSMCSLPTPEESLLTLQKKILEQASLRNALTAQQALQAQQVSYLENFNTNLKNLGKIGIQAEPEEDSPANQLPDKLKKPSMSDAGQNLVNGQKVNPLASINVKEMKNMPEPYTYEEPVEFNGPFRKCLKTIPWYDIEQYLEHSPTSFRNMKKAGYRVPEKFDEPPPPKKPWKMSRALKRELFYELVTLMELQKARGVPVTPFTGLTSDEEEEEEEPAKNKPEKPNEQEKETKGESKPSGWNANDTNFHIASQPTRFEEIGQISIKKQLSVSREATEKHFKNKKEAHTLKSKPNHACSVLKSKSLNNNVYPSTSKKKDSNGVLVKLKKSKSIEESSRRKSSNEFKHPNNCVMPIGVKRDQSTSRRGSEEDDKNDKTEEPSPKRRPPPVIQSTLDDEDAYNSFDFETPNAVEIRKEKNTFYVPDEDSDDDMDIEDDLPEQKPPPVVLKLKSSLNSRKRLESSTRNLTDENSSHARKIREETKRLTREDLLLTSSLIGSNNSKCCRNAISKQSLEHERQPMEEMRLEKRQKLSHDEPDIKVNADIIERTAVAIGENRQTLSGLAKPELILEVAQQSQSRNVFDVAKTIKALKYYKKILKMESASEMGVHESKRDNPRVYVEESETFRVRKEARYELGKRNIEKTKYVWSHEELVETLQKYFTYLSFLIQGVLTGLLLGDTIYTFSFENEKAFPKDQALALPLNSVMCAGCTVACIAVLDILTNMKATVENQAKREKLIVALALWIVALTTSALSIASDEILSPVNESALDEEGLLFRKLYCLTRSLSALGAWVFITYGMEMKRPKNEIGVNADVNQHVADELD